MATYDITSSYSPATSPTYGPFPMVLPDPSVITIDFSKLFDNITQANLTGLAAGDILKFVNIAKGTQIDGIMTTINTACPNGVSSTGGAAQTVKVTVGDTAGANTYNTAISLSASAGTNYYGDAGNGTTFSSSVKKYYTAQDYLKLTVAEAVSKGIVQIKLRTFDWEVSAANNVI